MEEFNGYSFNKAIMRKRMKYIVITDGDLDINGAYAFKTARELKEYLKESYKKVEAVFKVKDVTQNYNIK